MPRVGAIAVCLMPFLAGCGVLPTPRTDAIVTAVYAPQQTLSPEEKAAADQRRRQRREEEREQDRVRKREEEHRRNSAAQIKHLKENARRRRNGQENLPYKAPKSSVDCDDGLIADALDRGVDTLLDKAFEGAARTSVGKGAAVAIVAPFTLTADLAVGSAAALHKTMLGMSSNEYRSRHDNWDEAGAFD